MPSPRANVHIVSRSRPKKGTKMDKKDTTCNYPGCNRRHCCHFVDVDGVQTKESSKYCRGHTCISNNVLCSFPKEDNPDVKLCKHHRKCASPGCQIIADSMERQSPWHCPTHCCQIPVCREIKYGDACFCQTHLKYECGIEYCHYYAIKNTQFCQLHICEVVGCDQPRDRGGTCTNHLPCKKVGCKNFDAGNGLCDQHSNCREAGCEEIAGKPSIYCHRHECYMKGCHGALAGHNALCVRHTCGVEGCPTVTRLPDDSDSVYCASHECGEDGCLKLGLKLAGYCQAHACGIAGCMKQRASSSSVYCPGHQCREPGCAAAATVVGGYCDIFGHACREPRCPREYWTKSGPYQLCVEHYMDQRCNAAVSEVDFEYATENQKHEAEKSKLKFEKEKLEAEIQRYKEEQKEQARQREIQAEADKLAQKIQKEKEREREKEEHIRKLEEEAKNQRHARRVSLHYQDDLHRHHSPHQSDHLDRGRDDENFDDYHAYEHHAYRDHYRRGDGHQQRPYYRAPEPRYEPRGLYHQPHHDAHRPSSHYDQWDDRRVPHRSRCRDDSPYSGYSY